LAVRFFQLRPPTEAAWGIMDAHWQARLMALFGTALFAAGFIFWIIVGSFPG
jgi:hypothetical protein